jgi:hypothetical protein
VPNFAFHMPGIPEPMNREAFRQLLMAFGTAFPGMAITNEDFIAEGDTGRGTVARIRRPKDAAAARSHSAPGQAGG